MTAKSDFLLGSLFVVQSYLLCNFQTPPRLFDEWFQMLHGLTDQAVESLHSFTKFHTKFSNVILTNGSFVYLYIG